MIIKLKKSDAKEPFTFAFLNTEGKTIVKSESYSKKANAKNGIESVIKNCAVDARYEFKESKNGKAFFNVKATNGQVVGTSALFASEAERDAAIAELKADSAKAEIVEE
ncbi:YegP family protein [Vibrio sp. RC27]